MSLCRFRIALSALALLASASAAAEGSVADGFNVFDGECGECHSMRPGRHKKGPSLAGIVGQQAGAQAGFTKYSEALKRSGITWDRAQLDRYIREPGAMVPGGRMRYDGLPQAGAREDLIAFLESLRR